MATRDASRAITSAQLVGILAFTLALFFVVAFATKTADAYRLRNWRDQLRQEIADMERQRAALQAEIERRQSMAWVDQVLRSSGYLPEGVVRVIVEPEEGQLESTVQTPAPLPTSQAVEGAPALGNRLATFFREVFGGPHWKAWMELLFGFDDEGEPYYNIGR